MKENQIYKCECVDTNHKGEGVCKIDNFVVFVNGMLIGEKGTIKLIKLTKKFGYGQIVNLDVVSPFRVKPICPLFGICGGCDLMHLNYDKQLEYKLNFANQTLAKIGNINYEIKEIVESNDPYYYRNNTQIQYQEINGKVECGFYKKESNEVVPYKECFIQSDISTKISLLIKDFYNKHKISAYNKITNKGNIKQVIIRKTTTNDYMVIIMTYENDIPCYKALISLLTKEIKEIKSIVHLVNKDNNNLIHKSKFKLLYGTETIVDKLMGYKFIINYNSFFQTNHIQTEKLYQKVLSYLNPNNNDVVVDGYSGVGTISLLLAKKSKKVYGIEIIKEAVDNAKENALLNNVNNVEFILGKTEVEINNINDEINMLVVDPPRKGLDESLVNTILAKEIKKVIYVSCNITTLARDLKLLDYKYNIEEITLYDMFPQTMHIESVTILSLKTN